MDKEAWWATVHRLQRVRHNWATNTLSKFIWKQQKIAIWACNLWQTTGMFRDQRKGICFYGENGEVAGYVLSESSLEEGRSSDWDGFSLIELWCFSWQDLLSKEKFFLWDSNVVISCLGVRGMLLPMGYAHEDQCVQMMVSGNAWALPLQVIPDNNFSWGLLY